MRKLKILLTASGCPGAATLIKYLKNNGEREIEIIGVDSEDDVIGKFLCDKFFVAPKSDSEEYISFLLDIVNREKIDVVFPQSSFDVYPVSENRQRFENLGAKVLASDPSAIEIANNKYKMYEALRGVDGLTLPKYFYPKNLEEFNDAVYKLGYPEKAVCFKPHISKGSRGFRYIDPHADKRDQLMNQKPNNKFISLEEFKEIFTGDDNFPDFIVMEVAKGIDYDVMALCEKGEVLLTTVKTREKERWGIITNGELVNNLELIEATKKIISKIPLSYNISLQFIGNKLIEINPRTSSYIYQDNLIEPYLAIKLLVRELTKEQIREYQNKVDFGRRMVRYMDQIFYKKNKNGK